MDKYTIVLVLVVVFVNPIECKYGKCRDPSTQVRQDGGLCFEIPPWQLEPVTLEDHLARLRGRWGPEPLSEETTRKQLRGAQVLMTSEVSRYMDTVLAPFLDTYHRNIQNSYQQLTGTILKRIKAEINTAVQKKQKIYDELMKLSGELEIPELCDEERRAAKTLASKHLAQIHACTEDARASINKMVNYADEMINITKNHMMNRLVKYTMQLNITMANDDGKNKEKNKSVVENCLKQLAKEAVTLGYELDLSLTNARRHNEQSCERITSCSNKVKRQTDISVKELKDQLYQCVYA